MSIDGPSTAPDPSRTGEVVIVSGSYGAGHDAAAAALAEQLRAAGLVVRRLDVAAELPWRVGGLLRWLYFTQLRVLPGTWGLTLRGLQDDGRLARGVRRAFGWLGRRLVAQLHGSGLIVATHPFASQALGEARRTGRLDTPVVTYLTDPSVHRLWVHPDVDLLLAIHAEPARQARALGGRTRVVDPAVRLAAPVARCASRSAPWPADRPVALVVGGSCGIGDLEAAADDLLAIGLATPVVACGTNERLRRRLAGRPGIVALGWRDDLPALIAAADCVVQNAGGMSSLEALVSGTPTLTYRPIPGHGTTNAAALDTAGLVPWPRTPEQLADRLADVLTQTGQTGQTARCVREPSVLDVLVEHGLTRVPGRATIAA